MKRSKLSSHIKSYRIFVERSSEPLNFIPVIVNPILSPCPVYHRTSLRMPFLFAKYAIVFILIVSVSKATIFDRSSIGAKDSLTSFKSDATDFSIPLLGPFSRITHQFFFVVGWDFDFTLRYFLVNGLKFRGCRCKACLHPFNSQVQEN